MATARSNGERKQIAPRLASGHSRVNYGGRLPESIKQGLRLIAAREAKSMSWVMEEVIIDYFGLKRPKYKPLKQVRDEPPSGVRKSDHEVYRQVEIRRGR